MAPTQTTRYQLSSGTGTTLSIGAVADGEILVVKITHNGTTASATCSGGGYTWTQRLNLGSSGHAGCAIFTTTASGTSGFTLTVGGGSRRTAILERWANAALDATPVKSSVSNAMSTSLTTEGANSVISWVVTDWNENPVGSATLANSGVLEYSFLDSNYALYNGYIADTGSTGSKSYGVTSPTSTAAYCAGIEILNGMKSVSGSASAPVAFSASPSGEKIASSSPSAPVSLSASASGKKIASRTPTAPVTFAASAQSGRFVAATETATPVTFGASAYSRRVLPQTATAITFGATVVGKKIAIATPSTTPMSFGASTTGFKRAIATPVAPITFTATAADPIRIGGDPIPVFRPVLPPLKQPLRLIAQGILDKKWLDWDLPVQDVEITLALSGPTIINGYFKPDVKSIQELGMDAWATYIHAEIDGEIRASGILMPPGYEDEKLTLEAVGITTYPHGIPWLGPEYAGIEVDPLDIVRILWQHVQSYPEGNLGATLDATKSPVLLGEPSKQKVDDDGNLVFKDITNSDGTVVGHEPDMEDPKPYALVWWDLLDIGNEIDNLAKATPFDYYEKPVWNTNKTDVLQRIGLAYPRKGKKRFDLRFAQDENIIDTVAVQEGDDTYASAVIIVGAGEGRDAVRGYTGERYAKRLRRVASSSQKNVKSVQAANALALQEILARRGKMLEIAEITVDAEHPNAKIGEYETGDDILVEVDVPWLGSLAIWHRITAYKYRPDRDLVTISLARSDSFRYGSSI